MYNPPKLSLRFLRWFCHPRLIKPIEGDLMELYSERVRSFGKRKADLKFTLDVLQLFRPSIIKPADGTYRLTNYGMYKNYFKVSLRSLLRNKTFSLLNISGLSVGIASCILILIYVNNELSYDTYNSKYDRIHRVIHYFGDQGATPDYEPYPLMNFRFGGMPP